MRADEMVIYSDFDGTIASGPGMQAIVCSENIEAIKSFIKAGGKFGMASGRNHQSIDTLIGEEIFNMPYVESNGALVYDKQTDSYISQLFLDQVFKEYAYDFAKRNHLFLTALDKNDSHRLIFNDESDKIIFDYNRDLMTYEDYMNTDIYKVAFIGDKKTIDDTLIQMKDNICFKYVDYDRSGDIYIEIFNLAAGKWNGVKKAIEYMNIKDRKIVCLGDHYNDVEMIKNADIAICPNKAISQVKENADYIMKNNLKDAFEYLYNL